MRFCRSDRSAPSELALPLDAVIMMGATAKAGSGRPWLKIEMCSLVVEGCRHRVHDIREVVEQPSDTFCQPAAKCLLEIKPL